VFNEVMQVVIKVVNFVKSRYLKCRLFKDLCSTENAEHSTLLLYTAVRWFSRGNNNVVFNNVVFIYWGEGPQGHRIKPLITQ